MREILFRGILTHSNEWVEGNLLVAENGQPYILPSKIVVPDGHHLIIDSDEAFFVIPSTIGQFTGLHDRDGKRIFEGDKVNTSGGITDLIVRWNKDLLRFDLFNSTGFEAHLTVGSGAYLTIIGNIHES